MAYIRCLRVMINRCTDYSPPHVLDKQTCKTNISAVPNMVHTRRLDWDWYFLFCNFITLHFALQASHNSFNSFWSGDELLRHRSGQHCNRQWLIAWYHQGITWTSADMSSTGFFWTRLNLNFLKIAHFHSKKFIWICFLQNFGHFVQAPIY